MAGITNGKNSCGKRYIFPIPILPTLFQVVTGKIVQQFQITSALLNWPCESNFLPWYRFHPSYALPFYCPIVALSFCIHQKQFLEEALNTSESIIPKHILPMLLWGRRDTSKIRVYPNMKIAYSLMMNKERYKPKLYYKAANDKYGWERWLELWLLRRRKVLFQEMVWNKEILQKNE